MLVWLSIAVDLQPNAKAQLIYLRVVNFVTSLYETLNAIYSLHHGRYCIMGNF